MCRSMLSKLKDGWFSDSSYKLFRKYVCMKLKEIVHVHYHPYINDELILPSGKHVLEMYTPFNPTFVKINWGLQGYTYFLIFAPKHRLWVLVRTASPQSMF